MTKLFMNTFTNLKIRSGGSMKTITISTLKPWPHEKTAIRAGLVGVAFSRRTEEFYDVFTVADEDIIMLRLKHSKFDYWTEAE